MYLKSLSGCRLKIGSYPHFNYDARGGGGEGRLVSTDKKNIFLLFFSSTAFSIPSLTSKTTRFLSLPLPPGLKIEVYMDKLEGTINTNSGEIFLRFESRFLFSIGSIFNFPDLLVKTSLQTDKVKSRLHSEEGLVRQSNGQTKLVGVSIIPPTGNKILDTLLGLPNEALAVLHCELNNHF